MKYERVVLKKIMNEKMYKTVAATKYTIELYKFDKLGFLKLWTFQQVKNFCNYFYSHKFHDIMKEKILEEKYGKKTSNCIK